jgi:hypothetical protein
LVMVCSPIRLMLAFNDGFPFYGGPRTQGLPKPCVETKYAERALHVHRICGPKRVNECESFVLPYYG